MIAATNEVERHQQGRAGYFIVKLKKKNNFFTISLLNKKNAAWEVTFQIFVP